MNLQDKLEELKQLGAYSISLTYGEDVGCDDLRVLQNSRRVIVIYTPVGCLGEAKIMYMGTLQHFLSFDLQTQPIRISNPPMPEEYNDNGYYIWGADGVERVLSNPYHGGWKLPEEG